MTPGGITGREQRQRSNQVVPQSMRKPGSSSSRLSAGSKQMNAVIARERNGSYSGDSAYSGSRSQSWPERKAKERMPSGQQGSLDRWGQTSSVGNYGQGSEYDRFASTHDDWSRDVPAGRRLRSSGKELREIRSKGPAEVVLVYPNEDAKDAVTITSEEIARLKEHDFLNDSLVDYYMKVIQNGLPEEVRSRCHFFNSFFYKRLLNSTKSVGARKLRNVEAVAEGYKHVKRWTKNVDIFAKDFIFVPINEHLHWSLMVIYRPGAYLSEQRAKLSLPDEAAADDAADDVVSGGDDPDAGSGPAADDTEDDDVEDEREEELEAGGEAMVEATVEEMGTGESESRPGGDDEDSQFFYDGGREATVDDEFDAGIEAAAQSIEAGGSSSRPSSRPMCEDSIGIDDDDDELGFVEERPPRKPCILYIDSMNGNKQKAFALLKTYLHLEHDEKKAKKEAPKSETKPTGKAKAEATPGAPSESALRGGAADGAEDGCGTQASQASKSSDTPQVVGVKTAPVGSFMGDSMHLGSDDEFSFAGSGEPAAPAHLFAEYEDACVKVDYQHNGHDCGLYMLKYVEAIANHQPDLAKKKSKRTSPRWADHSELHFDHRAIDALRFHILRDIRDAGEKQKQGKAKRAKTAAQ